MKPSRMAAVLAAIILSSSLLSMHRSSAAARSSCRTSVCMARVEASNPKNLGLPFASVDPRPFVQQYAHLREVAVYPRWLTGPQPYTRDPAPVGPAQGIQYIFGHEPYWTNTAPGVHAKPTYVTVNEGIESEHRGIFLQNGTATSTWMFGADLQRQHITIDVESDGPKAVVAAIGYHLVAAARRLPIPPTRPEQLYVTPPNYTLHVGKPAAFWVLMGPRPNSYPGAADFDFTLSGGWARPQTVTPDRTQACGGDNVAGQPYLRHGRWAFNWGDCSELGLVLTPKSPGQHTLVIHAYSVPLTKRGVMDVARETPVSGGYVWHGDVHP